MRYIQFFAKRAHFSLQGDLAGKDIVTQAGRYVPADRVKEINATTHSRFVDDNPSVPKVLLFTEKKGIPLIYRALSIALDVIISLPTKKKTNHPLKKLEKNLPWYCEKLRDRFGQEVQS